MLDIWFDVTLVEWLTQGTSVGSGQMFEQIQMIASFDLTFAEWR